MFGIVSLHTKNYLPLSRITWDKNKVLYAKKHGYHAFYADNDLGVSGTGYSKIYLVDKILKDRPDIEWLWWMGADTIITNMHIKIEHKINNNYHLIMGVDFNNILCDSFLIRNSPEGRQIMQDVINLEESFKNFWDTEQRAFGFLFGAPWYTPGVVDWADLETFPKNEYKGIVKIVNQTYMNSYEYEAYYQYHPQSKANLDCLGYNGQWKPGDWLIHFAGLTFDQKVSMAKKYIKKVIQ